MLSPIKAGRRIMKEIRVSDIEGGGINIVLRCCGGKFCTENRVTIGQIHFVPSEQNLSQRIACLKCKRWCEVSYSEGFYSITIPGLEIIYEGQGKEICLSGRCYCQNNALRDDFTKEIRDTHCVDSQRTGEYAFSCPCNRTHILIIRDNHFHVCTEGECPTLTAKQSEE